MRIFSLAARCRNAVAKPYCHSVLPNCGAEAGMLICGPMPQRPLDHSNGKEQGEVLGVPGATRAVHRLVVAQRQAIEQLEVLPQRHRRDEAELPHVPVALGARHAVVQRVVAPASDSPRRAERSRATRWSRWPPTRRFARPLASSAAVAPYPIPPRRRPARITRPGPGFVSLALLLELPRYGLVRARRVSGPIGVVDGFMGQWGASWRPRLLLMVALVLAAGCRSSDHRPRNRRSTAIGIHRRVDRGASGGASRG